MSGFGGAGAFSDGKYNITNDFGGTLYEHIGKSQAIELMKAAAKATYGKKGDKIVQMNYDAIDAGAKQVVEIEVPESWKSCEDEGLFTPEVKGGREDTVKFVKNIQAKVNAQEGKYGNKGNCEIKFPRFYHSTEIGMQHSKKDHFFVHPRLV